MESGTSDQGLEGTVVERAQRYADGQYRGHFLCKSCWIKVATTVSSSPTHPNVETVWNQWRMKSAIVVERCALCHAEFPATRVPP
jgi:hypothetical protein